MATIDNTKILIRMDINFLILLDNYQGVGTSGIFYKGETRVINTFLKKVKKKAKSFKNLKKPMYIEK